MSIYRGTGGATSVSGDATIEEVLQYSTDAQAAAAAAAASQTAAASSATSASTSESNASTSETNAEAAKVAALAAQAAALAAQAAAEAVYDDFDDRYLGPKASAPTLDNDGNALATGALYYNTGVSDMYVYDGSSWLTVSNTTASSAAAASAAAAATSETNAATSETNAATSETNAATSASAASTSATNAATSELNASQSAGDADADATAAAASASSASTSATNAAASAALASAINLGTATGLADVRPSLNLDFANSKRLDPRITFTRATTATYYDGKTTTKAEQNLLTYSEQFDNAAWTKTNASVTSNSLAAPDGTSTADTITATAANATITASVTCIADAYTASFYIQRKTGTGTVEIQSASGTWTSVAISGSWARFDVQTTPSAGSKTFGVRIVTSGDEIYLWGAQVEQRSSVTSYTATTTQPITNYIPTLQTAASGAARFDHDPVTGESKGLLIEEQRTNLLTYSEQFDNAAWTKSNSSITANTIVAPDGTLTGDKAVEDTATSEHNIRFSGVTVSSSTNYSASVYVKAAERTTMRVLCSTTGPASGFVGGLFDLDAGTATNNSANSVSISDVGNGWYRCAINVTSGGSQTSMELRLQLQNTSYTGDGYSGLYLWGAQLEAGAFPTSYIPTVASTVTRNADDAYIDLTTYTDIYNPADGTIFTHFTPIGYVKSGGTYPLTRLRDSTSSNDFIIRYSSVIGGLDVFSKTNGTTYADTGSGTVAVGTTSKVSVAYSYDDLQLTLDGVSIGSDTAFVQPLGLTELHIADNGNHHIKKLAYYPVRLSNSILQAITEA